MLLVNIKTATETRHLSSGCSLNIQQATSTVTDGNEKIDKIMTNIKLELFH